MRRFRRSIQKVPAVDAKCVETEGTAAAKEEDARKFSTESAADEEKISRGAPQLD